MQLIPIEWFPIWIIVDSRICRSKVFSITCELWTAMCSYSIWCVFASTISFSERESMMPSFVQKLSLKLLPSRLFERDLPLDRIVWFTTFGVAGQKQSVVELVVEISVTLHWKMDFECTGSCWQMSWDDPWTLVHELRKLSDLLGLWEWEGWEMRMKFFQDKKVYLHKMSINNWT